MRVKCVTSFDITVTGVRHNFNSNRLPFKDQSGKNIHDEQLWIHARNQQHNWETINQLLSLRTLPHSITHSRTVNNKDVKLWEFEFTVNHDDVFAHGNDQFGALKNDCDSVPMITNLDETPGQIQLLRPSRNIWFTQVIE